jgi:hypothetical protein
MMENEEYENKLSQVTSEIARRGREIPTVAGVTLTDLKWHCGHEVADLDNYWLTLESDKHTVTEHFPNEWLEDPRKSANDRQIAQRLFDMVQALRSEANILKQNGMVAIIRAK